MDYNSLHYTALWNITLHCTVFEWCSLGYVSECSHSDEPGLVILQDGPVKTYSALGADGGEEMVMMIFLVIKSMLIMVMTSVITMMIIIMIRIIMRMRMRLWMTTPMMTRLLIVTLLGTWMVLASMFPDSGRNREDMASWWRLLEITALTIKSRVLQKA